MNLKSLIQPAYRRLVAKQGTLVKELEWTIRRSKTIPNGTQDPTRKLLVELIAKAKPETVLEVGCGWGQNLKMLSQKLPQAKLHGIDINRAAIGYTKKQIPQADLRVGRAEKDLEQYRDKSMDVTYTYALLMYIAPQEIAEVISEIKRITSKKIIIIELQTDPQNDPIGRGIYENGKWTRNYPPHFKELQIMLSKLPPYPAGKLDEGWKEKGIIIEATM